MIIIINNNSISNGTKYFSLDRLQICLVFISTRHVYFLSNNNKTRSWQSVGISGIFKD